MTDAVKWYCRRAIEEISRRVNARRQKFRAACYTVEGLNSFAVVIYFNYLYFFFRDQFGFNDRQNLGLAALIGLVYLFASLAAGRFAQRRGRFTALKLGFGVMAAGLAVGAGAAFRRRADCRRVRRQHRHVLHLAGAGGAGQRRRHAGARAACRRHLQYHLGRDQRAPRFSSAAR